MTAATIFHIGPVALTLTGIMCALGLTALIFFSAHRRTFTKAVGKKRLNAFFVFAIPCALLLGRLAYCLCGPERFSGRLWAVLGLHAGGYSFVAMLLGFVLAALACAHVYDLSKPRLLDLLTPGLLVLFALIRASEVDPGQAVGHVTTAKLLRSWLFCTADASGNSRFAVSRLQAAAALALYIAGAVRFYARRRAKAPDADGEIFATAAAALGALIVPIEALRDGVFPRAFGVSLDALIAALGLCALAGVSAARLWKTDSSRQYILIRLAAVALAMLLAALLPSRALSSYSPELASLCLLLCMLAAAGCIRSLRAARVRRLHAKEAADRAFVVRIPSADPEKKSFTPADLPEGTAEEVPAESRPAFPQPEEEEAEETDDEPTLFEDTVPPEDASSIQ